MKIKIILAILVFVALISFPCFADKFYPYSLTDNHIQQYIEQSTADKDLFEIGNDGWRINFDKQRQEFTTVGICSYPNGTLEEINAKAKEWIYTPRFSSDSAEPYIKGLEVHSLHFDKSGNETFIPFHYVVFPDGREEEMFLNPLTKTNCTWEVNQVPWAMGNWTLNCQSITIGALGDGNLTFEQVRTIRKRISLLQDIKSDISIKSRLSESQNDLVEMGSNYSLDKI